MAQEAVDVSVNTRLDFIFIQAFPHEVYFSVFEELAAPPNKKTHLSMCIKKTQPIPFAQGFYYLLLTG